MDESRFHAILLQNIHEGIIATDLHGTITYWNNGAESIFGYTAEEMIGSTPALLYPDQDLSAFAADLTRIDAGIDYKGEWRGRRKDGSEVWVAITTTVIRDTSETIIGYVGISRDITERKQLEYEVACALEREQHAHHQLRRFLAQVAHDLRQPLTVIRITSQLLRRSRARQDNSRSESYLHSIDEASRRMQRFIEDVQDAALIGVSQFSIHPVEMDLVTTLQNIVDEQDQTSDHKIVLHAPAELQGTWDRDRLMQLFTNLVTNATKYSAPGTEVRVVVEQLDNTAIIRVSDKGPGLSPDQQSQLFQAFQRLDHEVEGSGLGLYICYGIVSAHGGRIWIESEPGAGSDFVVELPIAPPAVSAPIEVAGIQTSDSAVDR